MGTDIHAAIEYRDSVGWHAVMLPNKYHGKRPNEPPTSARVDFRRDYDLFAVLADVRNGAGFAGCPTGKGFDPMAAGRGLPNDITPEAQDACNGDHSETHVSLSEILEYDWTQTKVSTGVVNAVQFEEWDRMRECKPRPSSYSGDVTGGQIRKITEAEMRHYVRSHFHTKTGAQWEEAKRTCDMNLIARIEWPTPYAEAAEQLWTVALPIMLKHAKEVGNDNVRLVMNFDS